MWWQWQTSQFFTVYTKCQTKLLVSIPTLLCLLQTKGNTFKARQLTFKPLFDYITSKLKEDATTVHHKKRTNQNLNTCKIVGASHIKYSNSYVDIMVNPVSQQVTSGRLHIQFCVSSSASVSYLIFLNIYKKYFSLYISWNFHTQRCSISSSLWFYPLPCVALNTVKSGISCSILHWKMQLYKDCLEQTKHKGKVFLTWNHYTIRAVLKE